MVKHTWLPTFILQQGTGEYKEKKGAICSVCAACGTEDAASFVLENMRHFEKPATGKHTWWEADGSLLYRANGEPSNCHPFETTDHLQLTNTLVTAGVILWRCTPAGYALQNSSRQHWAMATLSKCLMIQFTLRFGNHRISEVRPDKQAEVENAKNYERRLLSIWTTRSKYGKAPGILSPLRCGKLRYSC